MRENWKHDLWLSCWLCPCSRLTASWRCSSTLLFVIFDWCHSLEILIACRLVELRFSDIRPKFWCNWNRSSTWIATTSLHFRPRIPQLRLVVHEVNLCWWDDMLVGDTQTNSREQSRAFLRTIESTRSGKCLHNENERELNLFPSLHCSSAEMIRRVSHFFIARTDVKFSEVKLVSFDFQHGGRGGKLKANKFARGKCFQRSFRDLFHLSNVLNNLQQFPLGE